MAALLRQQIHEPREEASDREAIPVLTPIADSGLPRKRKAVRPKSLSALDYPASGSADDGGKEDLLRDKLGRAPAFSHSK